MIIYLYIFRDANGLTNSITIIIIILNVKVFGLIFYKQRCQDAKKPTKLILNNDKSCSKER